MARAVWSGVLSFGLVSIPVKLYSAVSKKNVKFNQIDSKTMSRIKQKRFNDSGEEVEFSDIVKGYEIEKDSYVILTDAEIESAAPDASRNIDISAFVLGEQIDPIFYDSAYHLIPDEVSTKAYSLLREAMVESGRVAIAKVVMRTKQYLVALRATQETLVMSTMVYADEVVAASSLPGATELESNDAPSKAEVEMANQLIESLSVDFDANAYQDTHREKLLEIISEKAAGDLQVIASSTDEDEAAVLDLMEALKASVEKAKSA